MIKSTIVDGSITLETVIEETLNERLERRIKKRVESEDFRVCAAHDLAPIFEKAFEPKDLAKDERFLEILDRSGLKLKDDDQWVGLGKQSFSPKKKGNRHRMRLAVLLLILGSKTKAALTAILFSMASKHTPYCSRTIGLVN